MSKFEARVKTSLGDLTLHFNTVEELRESLSSLDTSVMISSVREKLGDILVIEPRQPKTGAEFAYRFTPQGRVELLKIPSSAPMSIGLMLFAYDPEPVSAEEVFKATGAKPVNYVSQNAYKKYFDKTNDGKLILTHPGRLWVQNEILPELRKHTQER